MSFIKKKDIVFINNLLSEYKYDGIIFFIADENYSSYAKALLSSLFLFSENWLVIFIHIGNFKFNYAYKQKLLEITINLPNESQFSGDLKTYCANLRVPLLFELTTKLNIKKIVYTDVDNILVNDLNNLFTKKNFYIRKINLNLVDKLFNNAPKIMRYKSGVIILNSKDNKFLKDEKIIIDFVNYYKKFCLEDFEKWFSDQVALSKTFKKIPDLEKNSCMDKKVCDWDLSPFSFFWAAKGYIKETIIWKIISKKTVFVSILKRKLLIRNYKLFIKIILLIDGALNLCIYPLIVIRYKYFDFIFRSIRFIQKYL